jgi:hypothetical protein
MYVCVCVCMYVCIHDTHFVMSFVGRIIGVSNEIVNFSFTTMFVPALMFTREHYAPSSGRLQRKECALHHLPPKVQNKNSLNFVFAPTYVIQI